MRELIERCRAGCEVEVDGGIDATTAPLVVRAGATVLVAGSAVFGHAFGAAVDDAQCLTGTAERSALQRSQACNSE